MATGDILLVEQPMVVFGAGPGDDVVWSTDSNIANGTGWQSAQYDLRLLATDTAPRPNRFRTRFFTEFQGVPTLYNTVDIYLKTWDDPSDYGDNDLGPGDLQYTAGDQDKLLNLIPLGSAVVDQAAASTQFVLSVQEVIINARYLNVVLWNNGGSNISTLTNGTKLQLTPLVQQVQP